MKVKRVCSTCSKCGAPIFAVYEQYAIDETGGAFPEDATIEFTCTCRINTVYPNTGTEWWIPGTYYTVRCTSDKV